MLLLASGVFCLFVLNAQQPAPPPAQAKPAEAAKPATPADREALMAAD